jgi:hypothetical protein
VLEVYEQNIREAVKKLLELFAVDGLVHHEFVLPGQSVTGHFYVQVLRGCAMPFGGSGTTSTKRDSGFCITVMHRATHCLLCSNSC